MRKILSAISLSIFVFTLIACGQKTIDGVYEGKGGNFGMFEMKTMIVEKASDGSKFKVTFSGAESTLTYDNVEFQDTVIDVEVKNEWKMEEATPVFCNIDESPSKKVRS